LLNTGVQLMQEPVNILDKQLRTYRNQIIGTSERIKSFEALIKGEQRLLENLKSKEIEFKKAVDKLTEKKTAGDNL